VFRHGQAGGFGRKLAITQPSPGFGVDHFAVLRSLALLACANAGANACRTRSFSDPKCL
jgi:hypothetical protein